jgi:DNA replication protein DnaC
VSAPPVRLAPDLGAGVRLKLAKVREIAPEILGVAKVQRWTPDELLRALGEAEIAARDAANTANRLRAAAFPASKRLDGFKVAASSVPRATFDYLASLEWIPARENLCLV